MDSLPKIVQKVEIVSMCLSSSDVCIVINTLDGVQVRDDFTILTFMDIIFFVVCIREKFIFVSKRNGTKRTLKNKASKLWFRWKTMNLVILWVSYMWNSRMFFQKMAHYVDIFIPYRTS